MHDAFHDYCKILNGPLSCRVVNCPDSAQFGGFTTLALFAIPGQTLSTQSYTFLVLVSFQSLGLSLLLHRIPAGSENLFI